MKKDACGGDFIRNRGDSEEICEFFPKSLYREQYNKFVKPTWFSAR
jgi:hypothetical protein